MTKKCLQCDHLPALKGEEYCDQCCDKLNIIPNRYRETYDTDLDGKEDIVMETFERICEMKLDDVRELIMMIEQEFFIKSHKPLKSKPRKVPTYRWIEAGEQIPGCQLNHLKTKEERAIAHYRGECKNQDCKRAFMKVIY